MHDMLNGRLLNEEKRGAVIKNQKGIALVIALMFLLVFSLVATMLMYTISNTVKSSGLLSLEAKRYYGAEGGVLSAAAYMTYYKITQPPPEVLNTDLYTVVTKILGQTIRNPVGYSTLWKGTDVWIDAQSPPANPTSEVEAVVFVPDTPVGYGNE